MPSKTEHDPVSQIKHKARPQISGKRQPQHRGQRGAEQQMFDPFAHDVDQAAAASGWRLIAFSLIGRLTSAANTPSAIVMPHTVL